jgi:hypothetical protein
MAAMAPDISRSSGPTTSSGPLVMPPVNVPSGPSQHDLSMLTMPRAEMSSQRHESAPIASPVSNEHGAPMQLSGWETRNGPVNQIMQAIGHSTSGFLKLLVGIIRLIPGLGRN